MDPLGDIRINGKPYRIDLSSYRDKDLADFSPRAAVAGGSVAQSELMLYQPLYITDWRHGFGFTWNTDAMGYMHSMGNIDTRQPGIAMLFSAKDETTLPQDSGNNNKLGIVKFNGDLYTWGPAGVHKLSISGTPVWSLIFAGAVNYAMVTNTYLFFCPDGGQMKKMTTAGVITDAGIDTADDFKWLIMHKGEAYAGEDSTSLVHYASADDLSDMEGGATDEGKIPCGFGGFGTLGAVSFGNELYVFRRDGVYVVGTDKIGRRILDYSSEATNDNFTGKAIFNGYLYYSVRNKIYQWNGSRVVDVTPPRMSDQFPYSELRAIGPMVVANNFLYMMANWVNYPMDSNIPGIGSQGTYTSLFCFDGVGWHKLLDFSTSGGQPQYSSMFVDGDQTILYYFLSNSTAANSKFGKMQLGVTNIASRPHPTTGTNVLISSRLDMGFRRVDKFSPSILIEASNILKAGGATDRWLTISALMMGKGASETSGDRLQYFVLGTITRNGVTELNFPGVSSASDGYQRLHTEGLSVWNPTQPSDPKQWSAPRTATVPMGVYKYVILIVQFHTNNSDQSPILEGMTLRFLLRPDVFYGYNFNVVAATHSLYGDNPDSRTAGEIIQELKMLRNSKHPVEFIDIYGLIHTVYVSSVTNTGVERHEDSDTGAMRNIETLCNLNLVEVR